MINCIITKGKEELKVQIPQTKEFSFAQYSELKTRSDDALIFFYRNFKEGTFYERRSQYLQKLAKCLSELCEVAIDDFYELEVGDSNDHIKSINEIFEGKYDGNKVANTLYRCYELAVLQVNAHNAKEDQPTEGGDFKFTHNGVNYFIPNFLKDALTGEPVNPKLKTGQAIEAIEVERVYNEKIKALGDEEKDLDDRVNYFYRRDLFKIACLVRVEGKPFPKEISKIDNYINSVAADLQDMSMTTAKSILFFLSNLTRTLKELRAINGSLNRLRKTDQAT